ncbi:MAG TPA: carboxypeptidase regulatory-like domain-containing protein [Acidobacteriaceae bacterium]|nr:carboxypeptidase regulatory-like domain-containing protein [Acidobacteriaceae bacterium]
MPNVRIHPCRRPATWSLILSLICLVFLAGGAAAQFDTGTISGTTVDASGAVIPRAAVVIANVKTGNTVNATTDASGAFSTSDLPFGTYTVTANAQGFGTTTSHQIILNVGAAVHVTLKMAVAASTESVTVTGTETSVNTETAVAGETFNSTQIENLPVNGRDVSDFLEISPGSVGSTGEFQGSVNGLENIFSGLNITLDGQSATRGDINGYLMTEGQELSHVTRASIDSIEEIDFANNGYTAETGHSLGPQMNMITKGGTNQLHGTLFEFFRNDALDAHDYFETGRKQPLRLNQFGGNLAGPIVRDKLFFFVNYEGDREHLTTLNPVNHTLSAYARSLFVPSMQPILQQLMPLPAGCTAIPAPASCAFPNSDAGNTPEEGANMVYAPTALPQILREDTGSVRLDYNLTQNDRVMLRYNINDSLTQDTYGPNVGQTAPQALRTQLGKLDETHTFSPTLLNQFSLAVNRFYSDTESDTPKPYYAIAGFFTDLGSLPGANTFNQITPFNTYELFDNVTKVLHTNNLRFGTQIRLNRQSEWLKPMQTYDYASFSDLENNNTFVLAKNGYPGFLGIHDSDWDFYAQDNWRVNHKLVLNLGVRYEYNTVWRENHNQMQNFDIATQSFLPATQAPYTAPKSDIEPRIGIAYDPFGTGKTVVHAYAGIFYLPMWLSFGLTSNIPAYASYNVNVFTASSSLAFPAPNPSLLAGTQNVYAFPTHPKDPSATNWLFGIEQQFPWQFVAVINYSANKAEHQQAGVNFAAINENPANTATSAYQVYNGYAAENYEGDSLGSNYNALQVQLRRNAGHLNTEMNYTWSHELDDQVNVFSGFSDPFDTKLDRSSGDIDVRNNFTASVVYDFAEFKSSSLMKRELAGGWQASSIFQARSGLPENITLISGFFGNPMRPDYVPGQSPYLPTVKWPTQSYNAAAFAVPPGYNGNYGENIGDVGRNALRGPAFFQWDFSAMKNFPLSERAKLQFRADLFNILNHPNFNNPDGGICLSVSAASGTTPAGCTPDPNFGVVSSTIASVTGNGAIGNGTSRQAQFSMKLIF